MEILLLCVAYLRAISTFLLDGPRATCSCLCSLVACMVIPLVPAPPQISASKIGDQTGRSPALNLAIVGYVPSGHYLAPIFPCNGGSPAQNSADPSVYDDAPYG
jgi:hypothetical protein